MQYNPQNIHSVFCPDQLCLLVTAPPPQKYPPIAPRRMLFSSISIKHKSPISHISA